MIYLTTSRRGRPLQCRQGTRARWAAVSVELAFVAIFLVGLITGMVELARAVMVKTILSDAGRKGATTASRSNKTYTDIQNDVDDILNTDQQLPATIANGKAHLVISVASWNAATQAYGADTIVSSGTFAPQQFDKVSVKVWVNAADVTWFFLNYTNGKIESETVYVMRQ
jgi:Flp pilus assembly protein TadG